MGQKHPLNDGEVDLRDYFNIIVKRKKTILAVFFLLLIISTALNFTSPNVYEANAILKIGSISQPLMLKTEAIMYITSDAFLNSVAKALDLRIEDPELRNSIKVEEINNANFLKIKVRNQNPELAKKIAEAIAGSFVSRGEEIYRKNFLLLEEKLKKLNERKNFIENQIVAFNAEISSRKINRDYVAMLNTLDNYDSLRDATLEKIFALKELLINANDFAILKSPFIPNLPVMPGRGFNIAVSAAVGLILGIFIAFFQEFWGKSRES